MTRPLAIIGPAGAPAVGWQLLREDRLPGVRNPAASVRSFGLSLRYAWAHSRLRDMMSTATIAPELVGQTMMPSLAARVAPW